MGECRYYADGSHAQVESASAGVQRRPASAGNRRDEKLGREEHGDEPTLHTSSLTVRASARKLLSPEIDLDQASLRTLRSPAALPPVVGAASSDLRS